MTQQQREAIAGAADERAPEAPDRQLRPPRRG